MVSLQNVSRRFGSVDALTGVTLDAPAGSITVLLGPNGAGKTTAIRLVTGALGPDSGSVRVFGLDPCDDAEGEEVRRRCGVFSAKPSLYDRLSGFDNLRYAAQLYGLGRSDGAEARIREAASRFGIVDALALQVGGYSTGMKTRLALSRAVLHEPDLLLLDEPTSGLDPESAAAVLELIRAMTDHGDTVVLCTHLLIEAEGLADQVVVMEQGTVMTSGTQAEMADRYWPDPVVTFTAEPGADLGVLSGTDGVLACRRTDDGVVVTVDRADRIGDLILRLSAAGVRLRAAEPYHPSLEDIYFAVRGHRRADRPAPQREWPLPAPPEPSEPSEPDPVGAGSSRRRGADSDLPAVTR
ncbi:MAG: ATP-binding cassette domain-containing protein [Acidimicrobiales bacterium]